LYNIQKEERMKKLFAIILLATFIGVMNAPVSIANQEQRIKNLEKRVAVLESELSRLQQQEARASKYLKCVQKVEGNALTVPFKILNCIRK
jgi:uncharacterized protein (DUF3084 family)